ncbi:SLATT domain-containing protein [Lonepinella sp. MS14437]|uniref:SLATT domain-containing protein n=1 Tax=Lonepinella sp. MS14437 TaxID=3003620 RepID=UPI0036DD6A49
MSEKEKILEGQLRECYARVVYTHKTHEKCADILLKINSYIKWGQIILSAIITGGVITMLFDFERLAEYKKISEFITAIISTILLVLNSYTKDYDLGAIAQKHRQAAAEIWLVREKYLSLLTAIRMKLLSINEICIQRDQLMIDLHGIYTGAPSTNFKAYAAAQKALKELEDMTFSDEEIDKFLPKDLKRDNSNG